MNTEPESDLIGPLLEKAEAYGKTNVELLKLKSVDTAANAVSGLASRAFLFLALLFFAFMASVSAALWLGEYWGRTTLGFFALAGFYLVITIGIYLLRKRIKMGINNSMIQYLSEQLCKK